MIVFNYTISEILNQSKIISLYRANTSLNGGVENALEEQGLHEKDDPIIEKYLKTGCGLIADTLSGYARNLLDEDGVTELEAFEFNVTYDNVANSIVYRVNMPTTWPESAMNLIDDAIKDSLENYVVYRINKQKGIDASSFFDDWEDARGRIRSLLSRRTEPVLRRPITMF